MQTNKGFTERLREAMAKKGLMNQAALAKIMRVADGTLTPWFKGKPPRWDMLVALAEKLEVSIDWLLTGSSKHSPSGEAGPAPAEPPGVEILTDIPVLTGKLIENALSQIESIDKRVHQAVQSGSNRMDYFDQQLVVLAAATQVIRDTLLALHTSPKGRELVEELSRKLALIGLEDRDDMQ